MINVCFITDENYVLPTLVAMKSLIVNSNTSLSINLVTTDLSQNAQQLFHQLETKDAKINIIFTQNPCENITTNHEYITNSTYIKFELPNIFKDLDKILYIDADTLILKDLKELYDTVLEDNYAGVVQDIYVCQNHTHYKEKGLKNYFNAGVMLFNLKKIREDLLTDKLIEYAKNEKHKLFYDQDAYNFIFKEKVKWLSLKYNFLILPYTKKFVTSYLNISDEEYNKISDERIISHYAGIAINKMAEYANEKDFNLWNEYYHKMLLENFYEGNNAIYLLSQYQIIQNANITVLKHNIYNLKKKINKLKNKITTLEEESKKENIFQKIFSIRNDDCHKIIKILFLKMKFKMKNK